MSSNNDINNQFLINAYDYTESLIQQTPTNEDQLISNYINFIIQYKLSSQMKKSYIRTSTANDVTIQNNSSNIDINNKESFTDYYKEMTGGFKESYSF
jgi:hypothetical protein